MDFGGVFDPFFFLIWILGAVATLAVPVLIVGLVVWVVRRGTFARRDPAEDALRERYARGEIDESEYQARLRTLRDSHPGGQAGR